MLEREDPYRFLFSHLASGLAYCKVLVDGPPPHDIVCLEVNDAFEALTDLRNVVGKSASEIIPGIREADPDLLAICADVALTGRPQKLEKCIHSLDRCFTISLYSPKKEHFVALFDLAECDQRLEAQRERERKLRSEMEQLLREQQVLLESANVGIVRTVGRTQVWVNRWMEDTFGYARDEMIGKTTRMFYRSLADFEALAALAAPKLARGQVFEAEVELVRKDGTFVWIKYNGKAIDPKDASKGFLWVLSDETAARKADEAMRESEARLRNIFESHNVVMLLIDPSDGRIIDANPAASGFYGYDRGALCSMNISAINALPKDEVRQKLASAARKEEHTFVFPHRMADGTLRTVEVHSSAVEVTGRKLLFSIVQDVTARKEFERQLELKQAQLEDLNVSLEDRIRQAVAELRAKDQLLVTQSRHAAMGEMIGNIAHQWRQPLNALGLVLSNLRDASRFGELDAQKVEQAVSDGNRLIQKMSSTINDFRDFFRPNKEKCAFSALKQVRETVGLLDASFRHANISLEVEAAADLDLFGFANEYSQILLNLLSNAKQAIQAAGVSHGRVKLKLTAKDGFGCLSVRDNGGGIPLAAFDRLFEPYFSTKEGGTGLGLYMSRQIVERSLGGRLEAANVEDGAEFTVLTPLADQGPGSSPAPR